MLFSSQTAYSLRKSRISKIIAKYQHRSNHLDEFFRDIFFSSSRAVPPAVNATLVVQSWSVRCSPSFSPENKKNSVLTFFSCLLIFSLSFAHQNNLQWGREAIRISMSRWRGNFNRYSEEKESDEACLLSILAFRLNAFYVTRVA